MMGNDKLFDFLGAIDRELAEHAGEGETLELHLLGRSVLILGYGATLMTKDVDIVYVHGSKLQEKAIEAFGRGSPGAARYDFYLETVPSGLPPLPIGYQTRSIVIPGPWTVIRPKRPEIHDFAATKLKRFHAGDREDLRILGDTGELTVNGLTQALNLAFTFAADEDEDPNRRTAFANLRTVIEYLEGRRRAL